VASRFSHRQVARFIARRLANGTHPTLFSLRKRLREASAPSRGCCFALAIPAGIGDILTGIFAPLVAYWWFAAKPYARALAIAWNLFGMADLLNALALGALTGGGGGGIVFPIVLIPVYAVPRALLIHSFSLIGLLRKSSWPPKPTEALHYGAAPP
jgi:hypothetical protein